MHQEREGVAGSMTVQGSDEDDQQAPARPASSTSSSSFARVGGLGWLEGTLDAMLSGLSPTSAAAAVAAASASSNTHHPAPTRQDPAPSDGDAIPDPSIEVPLEEEPSSIIGGVLPIPEEEEEEECGLHLPDLSASNNSGTSGSRRRRGNKAPVAAASSSTTAATTTLQPEAPSLPDDDDDDAHAPLLLEEPPHRNIAALEDDDDDADAECDDAQGPTARGDARTAGSPTTRFRTAPPHSRQLYDFHGDGGGDDNETTKEEKVDAYSTTIGQRRERSREEKEAQQQLDDCHRTMAELQLLNRAQDEEVVLLKTKLEEAVQELETREQHEVAAQLQQQQAILDLDEARHTIRKLEQDLLLAAEVQRRRDREEEEKRVVVAQPEPPSSPLVRMAPLDDKSLDDNPETTARLQELEARLQAADTKFSLARASHVRQLQDEKDRLVASHQLQLQHCQQASAQSEADLREQLATVQADLLELKRQQQLSEEEKPKGSDGSPWQLPGPHNNKSATPEQQQPDTAQDAYKQQVQDLQDKLEDRDTTISELVKSSVGLEQQLASASMESEELRRKLSSTHAGETTGLDVIVSESASKEQLEKLQDTLDESRRNENQLLDEVDRLQHQVHSAKVETSQLRSRLEACKSENLLLRSQLENDNDCVSITNSSIVSSSPHLQIQERDAAIANLVQQSIEQDRLVSDLQARLATMQQQMESLRRRSTSATTSSPRSVDVATLEEMRELRRETEMFAGQVIEQDEEIEALTKTVQAKEKQVAALQRQLDDLRGNQSTKSSTDDADKIKRLTGEIDELTEANNVLRDEVRMLRRKAKDMEASAQEIDRLKHEIQTKAKDSEDSMRRADLLSQQKAELEREFREAKARGEQETKERVDSVRREFSETVRNLEAQAKESDRTIVGLRAASSMARNTVDELEVENLRSEIVSLQRNLQHQTLAVENAKGTIRELEHMLAERNADEMADWEVEKEELLTEVESLAQQLEEARHELILIEEQRVIIEDFKHKLEDADEAREESEKSIVDNYERKLSLLKLDKDVTIDKLRKDLAEAKEMHDTEIDERAIELQQYQEQVAGLQHQMSYEIQERETQIFALERTLEAQEQLVNNMKSEMDILQGSMENRTVTRREEIEIMQQELVDLTTLAAQQERDIRTLQGKLQDQKAEYESQIATLKETIALLESEEEADHRTAADLKMEIRVREVKERLEKLKWRNTSLSEENEVLRERLQRAEQQGTKDNDKTEERSKELSRVLAERELKLQMVEAELRELKLHPTSLSSSTAASTPSTGPSESNKGTRSPMCSPISPTGKSHSTRRLGFLARRASSAKRPSQA